MRFMARQILAVAVGIVLNILLEAAGGYFLYLVSNALTEGKLGQLARYIISPVTALLVGACVGALAKARPGLLAALSVIPLGLYFFRAWHRVEGHFLFFLSLQVMYLLIAATAASLVFRARARMRRGRQEVQLTNN